MPTEELPIRSSLQLVAESEVAIDEDEETVAYNRASSAPTVPWASTCSWLAREGLRLCGNGRRIGAAIGNLEDSSCLRSPTLAERVNST